MLVELSVVEQRYAAVLEVIRDGLAVADVAARFGVSRQTVYTWIHRYETGGLAALADGSHKPASCPHPARGQGRSGGLRHAPTAPDVGSGPHLS